MIDTQTVKTESRCQIERIIEQGGKTRKATFVVHEPTVRGCSWNGCSVMIMGDQTYVKITNNLMLTSLEQAAALENALHMAISWAAEEQTKED